MSIIYMDHAGGLPQSNLSNYYYTLWSKHFTNPSSKSGYGLIASEAIQKIKQKLLGDLYSEYEIIFTSGASESNSTICNHIIKNFKESEIFVSITEHASIESWFEDKPNYLYTNIDGKIDLESVKKDILGKDVKAIICGACSSEIHTKHDIKEIAKYCNSLNIFFHCDFVQLAGKEDHIEYLKSGITSMSISAHKFGGPLGTGMLIYRKDIDIIPLIKGKQNNGKRGGTENVPGIVSMYYALKEYSECYIKNIERVRKVKEKFIIKLKENIGSCIKDVVLYKNHNPENKNVIIIFGDPYSSDSLDGHLLISYYTEEKFCNSKIKEYMEKNNYIVGIGSVCNSKELKASNFINNIVPERNIRKGILRLSFYDKDLNINDFICCLISGIIDQKT